MPRPAQGGWLLGLDVGSTRIKAVVLDAAGHQRADASVPTPFVASADGVDMEVADLGRALAAVIAAVGSARERVAAVGLTGMAESGAPFRAGRAVAPVIAWHDGRGRETVASLEGRFGPALARWTGRRVRTVSSVAKLGWLLDHGLPEPDRWLGVPELVLFLLTGAEATEHSLAARTGAYDVTERRFLPEVIAHVLATEPTEPERFAHRYGGFSARGRSGPDRPAGLFPAVRSAGAVMGIVTEDGAARYGLPAGIPVTIAGHDHLAAAAGLGARPDDLLNSVGTAETLVRRLDSAPDMDRALELDLAVTLWPGGEAWAVLASAARAGLVIDALAAHLGVEPAALDDLVGNDDAAGSSGAGVVPESVVDAPPGAVADVVSLGQGIEVPAGPAGEMWMATLAALTRRTAAAAERVAALAGPHQRLVVFGGGSRSPAWLRAKAAEVGVPVLRSPVAEAAAHGAALAAGVAAGWWPALAAAPTPALDPSPPAGGGPPAEAGPVLDLPVGPPAGAGSAPAIDAGGGPAGTMGP
ncbi:MAG TPA: FGGY family carbohydrate kinase [Acidimicrobiia bacterium]|nr:FGGY family carbohydrate kinase [Acidimicrobiia bacterium]